MAGQIELPTLLPLMPGGTIVNKPPRGRNVSGCSDLAGNAELGSPANILAAYGVKSRH